MNENKRVISCLRKVNLTEFQVNFVAYAHTCKLTFENIENITTTWPTWEFIVQVARVPCSHLPVRCSIREK